jgi:xanthine dehydrogenase accessory factor
VYEIAFSVTGCLRAGTRVDVAWLVESRGLTAGQGGEAVAITPGGGRVGSLLAGALNDRLADLVAAGVSGRLVDLPVSDIDALVAGLPSGGDARCLLMPAADLPPGLWERLRHREPVALVARLDGDRVVDTSMFGPDTITQAADHVAELFGRRVSGTTVTGDAVTTVLWPVPTLVIVGAGPVVDALGAAAGLLGWRIHTITDGSAATGVIATLVAMDKVVVFSHDEELAGTALAAALAGEVGYIGSVGSRRMQRARADWLAYRDITDLRRIHGPAGLDIGASTPAEIAVSIVAESLAVSAAAEKQETEPSATDPGRNLVLDA